MIEKEVLACDYDAVVSFVLFRTSNEEIRSAVAQVLASPGRNHVVLVDNSVPSLELGFAADPRVTIIQPGANVGYGTGHNLALRRFSGRARYHFVLNTDLSFARDVIPRLISAMDADPGIGMAMPLVRYPDGRIQHLCRLLPRPIDIAARALFPGRRWAKRLNRRYEFWDWGYDESLNFPFLSGCFMVLRPQALMKTGLFDEAFFLFAEDLDLSRRLHRVSRTVLCPDVEIFHEYRTKSQRSWRRKVYLIQSFIKYFNKYGWFIDRERTEMNRRALAAARHSPERKN